MCVCSSLCTIFAHNTVQNTSDNFPSCPPDNYHCSDDARLFVVKGVLICDELCLMSHGELDFPLVNLATYREQEFAYAGPISWKSLPDSLMDINLTLQTFKRHLKTFLFFPHTSTFGAFEAFFYKNVLYKSTVIVYAVLRSQEQVPRLESTRV